jgi:hypothetical protein
MSEPNSEEAILSRYELDFSIEESGRNALHLALGGAGVVLAGVQVLNFEVAGSFLSKPNTLTTLTDAYLDYFGAVFLVGGLATLAVGAKEYALNCAQRWRARNFRIE